MNKEINDIEGIIYSNIRGFNKLISIQKEFFNFLITLSISGWLCCLSVKYNDFELLRGFIFGNSFHKIIYTASLVFFILATIKLINLVAIVYKVLNIKDFEEEEKIEIYRAKKTKLNLFQRIEMDCELSKIKIIIGEKLYSELIIEVKNRSGKNKKNAYFYYVLFFEYFDIMENLKIKNQ